MEITGTIIAVLPAQSGTSQRTGNQWMRQEYVIEVPGMYPRRCCFSIFGEDRIRQFALQQGQQNVTVHFDIDAHEHEGRWYNEVRAYNVIHAGQQMQQPAAQPAYAGQPAPSAAPAPSQNPFPPQQPAPQGNDLPF